MRKFAAFFFFLPIAFFSFLTLSCGTTGEIYAQIENSKDSASSENENSNNLPEKQDSASIQQETKESSLTLIFAGDIMAHAPNFKNTDFERIWRDVAPLVQTGDLSFANVEAPVADSLPWSTYPQFNMHTEYVEAAISAGFNVFSLVNNHTNDQSLAGMKETKKYFDSRKGIWASGLKENSGDALTYKIIEKNGGYFLWQSPKS